ncbi:MAG: 30S ribosomal protein S9 [Candidatus Liptonbacteria bacterium]|nr:30S ribosomal protein S9 [Candidatus Liptonbacteria bacterium]
MVKDQKEKIVKAHPAKALKKDELAPRYFGAVGRRKTAIARVRVTSGHGSFYVNEKEIGQYFQSPELSEVARHPLKNLKLGDKFNVSAHVSGGGLRSQTEAIRHGLARALILLDPELKKRLRVFGFLTRDSRMVERKKYGLKKARRAPQWKKR